MVQKQKKPRGDTQPSLRDRAATLRSRMPGREADPIFDVIKDGRPLLEACRQSYSLPETAEGSRPAGEAKVLDDLFEHFRETIPQTPPETPIGAVALAKYVVEIQKLMGDFDISEDMAPILKLIVEVRLA